MATVPRELDPELLEVRVAELYYEENKTQDEIGAILRITRWKVGRLLAHARDSGIVRFEIAHPKARRLALEHDLVETFGLTSAVVVPRESTDALADRVASAAADFLVSMRPRTHRLGLSWGNTLHRVSLALPAGWSTPVEVVQVNGAVSKSASPGLAAATASMVATKSGGAVTLLPTPAILERPETREAIESDRAISQVLELARVADTYLFSAGPATDVSIHLHSGYIDRSDISRLQSLGAVGDVLGRYVRADGSIADPELDDRTLGLSLESLRAAPRSIAVLSGSDKHAVARAIVTSGLATVVVTDEDTATFLLEHPPQKVS